LRKILKKNRLQLEKRDYTKNGIIEMVKVRNI